MGIEEFWTTGDVVKCRKLIGHLRKVVPTVIEVGGEATGYRSFSYMYMYSVILSIVTYLFAK